MAPSDIQTAEAGPVQPRRFVERHLLAGAAARMPRIDAEKFRSDLDAVVDQYATSALSPEDR
jgi:hypothetical protein